MEHLTLHAKKGILHHAYLIEGDRAVLVPALRDFVEGELKLPTRGNPDVLVLEYESFGIDEGRYLSGLESFKAAQGGIKIFILAFHFITREAQNAFLKLFEEPLPGTHFFLVTASADLLLPTLRSRLMIIEKNKSGTLSGDVLAQKFLTTSPSKRIELFKKMLDEKDKAGILSFLNALEVRLYDRLEVAKNLALFSELQKVRGYATDTSASLKMLLEHLSLIIPAK